VLLCTLLYFDFTAYFEGLTIRARSITSSDGGQTWTLATTPPLEGAIFCLASVRRQPQDQNGYGTSDNPYNRAVIVTSEAEPDYSFGKRVVLS
jgi:hypothetical protein